MNEPTIENYPTDTRIAASDPLIPYIQHVQKVWGADHDRWHAEGKTLSFAPEKFDRTDLIDHARSYRDRDTFIDLCRVALVRDDMIEFAFDVSKFGGSPGGSPYAEMKLVTYTHNVETATWVDHEHEISFGLDVDGDKWYVQLESEFIDGGMEFEMIEWRDVSPAVIAHYVNWYADRVLKLNTTKHS